MEDNTAHLSRRQLATLGWVALLSPLIRQVPQSVVPFAGRAAWLSPLLAAPLLLLILWFFNALLRRRGPGEGLGELCRRALGERAGRAVLLLYALWLLFYAGYGLRSGADRFVSAVYPESQSAVFLLVMAALCAMAALGRLKVLARCAQAVSGVLFAILVLVLLGTLPHVGWAGLLPLRPGALPGALLGALSVADTLGILGYAAFLAGEAEPGEVCRPLLPALGWLLLLATLLCVTTLGVFGADLTGKMNYPFFVMIRDVRLFRLLERIEALVIAQWVCTDFFFLSLLLHAAVTLLRQVFPRLGRTPLALGCVLAATVAGLLCAPTFFDLTFLRQWVTPAGNAVLLFLGLPVIFLVGILRKKI